MNLLKLSRLAADLGITTTELLAQLTEAVDAGFLRVVAADDHTVTLQGVDPLAEED